MICVGYCGDGVDWLPPSVAGLWSMEHTNSHKGFQEPTWPHNSREVGEKHREMCYDVH